MSWSIPHNWFSSKVFIIAGGPSVAGLDLCLPPRDGRFGIESWLYDREVIGVNSAFRLGSWVDVAFFGDAKFYWWNRSDLAWFSNPKISCDTCWPGRDKSIVGETEVNVIGKGCTRGFDNRPTHIGWNRSSGAAAIDLAYHLGGRKIFLVGYDMKRSDDGRAKNWLAHSQESTNQNPYEFMRGGMKWIADQMPADLEIFNCTPDSALDMFPFVRLEDV